MKLRTMMMDGIAQIGSAIRNAATTVHGAAWSVLAGAKAISGHRPSAGATPTFARFTSALDAVSKFVAAKENRLRITGMATLGVIVIALGAYGGGVLLARLARPAKPEASPTTPAARPATAATSPAAPLIPPTEPVARAAFYMARAKAGDAAAQYDLGVFYAQGDGLVQDYASAASWFHAAAAQGDIAAEYNLGVLYARGLGVKADAAEALNWYRSAADRGHAEAQFNLALALADGIGTSPDLAAAVRWYQRAAQQGLAPAMVNLAILYDAGNGVARSLVDAYAWYSVAGERDDAAAKARAEELLKQFNDRDKARAQGLAATIGAALDAAAPPS